MTAPVEGVNNSLEREERWPEGARWEDEIRGGRWGLSERGSGLGGVIGKGRQMGNWRQVG